MGSIDMQSTDRQAGDARQEVSSVDSVRTPSYFYRDSRVRPLTSRAFRAILRAVLAPRIPVELPMILVK